VEKQLLWQLFVSEYLYGRPCCCVLAEQYMAPCTDTGNIQSSFYELLWHFAVTVSPCSLIHSWFPDAGCWLTYKILVDSVIETLFFEVTCFFLRNTNYNFIRPIFCLTLQSLVVILPNMCLGMKLYFWIDFVILYYQFYIIYVFFVRIHRLGSVTWFLNARV
jgi:hypothetical protein